jgi:hypothetical protein
VLLAPRAPIREAFLGEVNVSRGRLLGLLVEEHEAKGNVTFASAHSEEQPVGSALCGVAGIDFAYLVSEPLRRLKAEVLDVVHRAFDLGVCVPRERQEFVTNDPMVEALFGRGASTCGAA